MRARSTQPHEPRLAGMPRMIDASIYEEVQAAAVATLAMCPEVRSVFRMGTIGHPGISDLDLIVVAQHGSGSPEIPDVRSVHPHAAYVMMHSPFLISEDIFPHINVLASVSNLERLWGDIPVPPERPAPPPVRLHLVVKYALESILFLTRQLTLGSLQVRPTLCSLNTISHLVNLARPQMKPPAEAERLAAEIKALRDRWFLDCDVLRLWSRATEALLAYLAILDSISFEPSPGPNGAAHVMSWMNMDVCLADSHASSVSVERPRWLPPFERVIIHTRNLDYLRWHMCTCVVLMSHAAASLLRPPGHPLTDPQIAARADILGRYSAWFGTRPRTTTMLCPRVDTPGAVGAKWRAVQCARRRLT